MPRSCIDIAAVASDIERSIRELEKRPSRANDCENSWVMPDGRCLNPRDEHDSVISKRIREKVLDSMPNVSTREFVYWVMMHRFGAIRIASWNSVDMMAGMAITRKQVEAIEFAIHSAKNERDSKSYYLYIDVHDERMPDNDYGLMKVIFSMEYYGDTCEELMRDFKKDILRYGSCSDHRRMI